MSDQLGFSVSCYRGDIPLLRGCLASIREFAPDAPICLIADGNFSTRSFERSYGAQVIRRGDVKDPGLRKFSFGFGLTKMVAFWEAPFERVFHVDADAVLWGDIRKNLPAAPWDVVYNEPHEIITAEIQNTQYFDPKRIFDHIAPFPWMGNPYFQAGIVCVRRGALDLDEYMRMLEGQRKYPDVFVNGDQGMLNILVFRSVTSGRLIAKQAHLQTVIPVWKREDLEKKFRSKNGSPIVEGRPTILHWAGPKPWNENRDLFRRPMDDFRGRGMRACGLPGFVPLGMAASLDELLSRQGPRTFLNCKKRLKSLLGRK